MSCNYYEHRLKEINNELHLNPNLKSKYPEVYEELLTEQDAILRVLGAK